MFTKLLEKAVDILIDAKTIPKTSTGSAAPSEAKDKLGRKIS